MANPIPGLDTPVVDPQSGKMTQVWYSYFQSRQKLTQLPDVSTAPPLNNQVLIYNFASGLWIPGAN